MNWSKFKNLLIRRMRTMKGSKRFKNPWIFFFFFWVQRGGWIWESRERQKYPLHMALDLLQYVFSMGNLYERI